MENDAQIEEIHQRHRKEKKELQAKIQALKKSATKGDKKKKREVAEEIIKLELELHNKHSEELSDVGHTNNENESVTKITEELNKMSSFDDPKEDGKGDEDGKDLALLKHSKAHRRREKKANQLKERELRIAEQEEQNIYGARNTETETIKATLKERGLMISEIPSDGNCLYRAVADQLKQSSLEGAEIEELRERTGEVLRENREQFLPFLSHPDTGEMLTELQYSEYCDQVAHTTAWGGQVELLALCEALKCRIEVIQGSGTPVLVGDTGPLLVLTYHRHLYGLGEHYNSVKPYQELPETQEAI